jgi:hypothetical protein
MLKSGLFVAAVALSLVACGGEGTTAAGSGSAAAKAPTSAKPADSAKPATTGAATGSAAPADSAAAAGDVSPEMQAFLKELDGTDDGVKKALKKVAKPGLDDKDMEMYTLREAKVIKTDKKSDKQTCYDFEAKAGMMVYTYGVCWEGGKIVAVEDKGSK